MTVGPPGVLALRCRPQPQLTIASGQSGEARLEAQKSDGTFEDPTLSGTWSSSTTAVGTVSGGVVRGIAPGDAVITSAFGGLSTTCPVHVAPAAPSYGIRPPDPILLGLGGKLQLLFLQYGATTQPSDLTGTATWTSSATAVASVASGVVTGVSAGTSTITACVATNCASTLAVVGNDLDVPGNLPYQRYAIGNSQKFNSLRLRQGTVTYLVYDAVGLTLNVGSFRLESGASLIGDGHSAPGSVSDGSITANGEGGDGAPGGGGGGGGGAILFSGNVSASIRIDGLISVEGGGGGMLRSATNAGPGGAGAGGSFFVDATSGSVTGSGTISVRGGAGGRGSANGACGGGGGGGGGVLQISAPVAGPYLVTLIQGGAGGAPCGGGGQRGEAGNPGVLKRP